jgi:hypothetical protein
MGDSNCRQSYILSHDDGAGPFVDDDSGRDIGLNLQRFKPGDKVDNIFLEFFWNFDRYRPWAVRKSRSLAELDRKSVV